MVYADLEPFGSSAGFWQAGVVSSTIANVNRTKKTQKAFTPEDFMPSTMNSGAETQEQPDVADQVVRTFKDMEHLQRG